ncbi:MAG: formimidoylglutamase [Flavobacteriales bacterium]|nr:formimidoylglutamase [Flavobacteriales bacterium]
MDFKDYLQPYQSTSETSHQERGRLRNYADFYKDDFDGDLLAYDIFILGVPEGRLSLNNESCAFAPDEIRCSLYELYRGDWSHSVLDLGNLKLGNEVEDTYVALQELSSYLIQHGKVLLVLGGGHDLIIPIYKGHAALGKPVNFASADAYLDFQDGEKSHSRSFLSQLLASQDSLMSQYSLLGYQSYLCSPRELKLLEEMDVHLLRLAEINSDLREVEPYVRGLDHLSIDLSVVKSSEAPASVHSSPNGLTAASLCAIMRYTGMNIGLKSMLFSELNPRMDGNKQSAKVYAQAIWHFFEGYQMRCNDFPNQELNNFQKFYVSSELSELVFYKSQELSRWWVELPTKDSLLPCSFIDYKNAVEGLLSHRLLKYIKH